MSEIFTLRETTTKNLLFVLIIFFAITALVSLNLEPSQAWLFVGIAVLIAIFISVFWFFLEKHFLKIQEKLDLLNQQFLEKKK